HGTPGASRPAVSRGRAPHVARAPAMTALALPLQWQHIVAMPLDRLSVAVRDAIRCAPCSVRRLGEASDVPAATLGRVPAGERARVDYTVNRRKSSERLEASLKRLGAVFAGARVATLTPDRLARYVADRVEQGAARATIRNEVNALKRALHLARRASRIAQVPPFPTVEPGPARAGFLEDTDLPGLLRALPAHQR